MTDNKDDFDDELIVPARDELRSHGSRQRRGNSIPLVEEAVVSRRASGAVRFLLSVLILGLLGTGGAGYFFYTQGQAVLDELEFAGSRILLLEDRLAMTDEAAQQSSLGLLERVDFNFSEIDKLWAARNQNRSDISANEANLAEHDETFTSIETVISGQSTSVNENTTLLASIQTRIETLSTNLAGMNSLNLAQQLASINEDLVLVKASMATQDSGLATRVNSNEQDIESINIYRLQLNQTLNAIQNSINNLQQQLGPQF
jgi:chromosome segregation ATPase